MNPKYPLVIPENHLVILEHPLVIPENALLIPENPLVIPEYSLVIPGLIHFRYLFDCRLLISYGKTKNNHITFVEFSETFEQEEKYFSGPCQYN